MDGSHSPLRLWVLPFFSSSLLDSVVLSVRETLLAYYRVEPHLLLTQLLFCTWSFSYVSVHETNAKLSLLKNKY